MTGAPALGAPAHDLHGCRVFVFGVRGQNEVSDALVGRGVGDRAQKRNAACLAVDGLLACGEGHVATGTTPALPDSEPNELEALERPVREVQLGVCEPFDWLPLSFGWIFTVMLSVAILLIRGYRGSFASKGARNAREVARDGPT
jgi:hypothetical protein